MKEIQEILKERHIRATKYRLAVLSLLKDEFDRFISIDEIRTRISEEYPKFDFSTAYRALELFEEKQLVYKTKIDDKICYTIECDVKSEHHHLICKNCGKKIVLNFCPFEDLEQRYVELGFDTFDHMRDFFGICQECKRLDDKINE
jgi:Fe2+ or Zn2+ uptake regulation protein